MLIGVVGLISSGKGTVGNFLVDTYSFKEESFAKSVKDSVASIFVWDRDLLDGSTLESRYWREQPDDFWSAKFGYEVTPRYILQQFGTNVVRDNMLDSMWINSLEKRIIDSNDDIVITDVRFPNELKFIKEMGGFLIQVNRGDYPNWFPMAIADNKNDTNNMIQYHPEIHKSEYSWVGTELIDFIVMNDSTTIELEKKITKIINSLTFNESIV